jgi:hypothetical protein
MNHLAQCNRDAYLSQVDNLDLGRVIEAAQAMAEKWSELTSQQSAELVRGVVRRIVLQGSELEIEIGCRSFGRWPVTQGMEYQQGGES